jgi:nucleotide-binding universal stress UspA family protein
MKILVATDFSPSAGAAADWAVTLARAFDAEVIVLHVLDPARVAAARRAPSRRLHQLGPYAAGGIAELVDWIHEDAAQRLALETARYPKARTLIKEGVPGTTILEAAAELQPDLIVVGTQGLTGLAHFLLGSVAEHIVRHSRVPVLTVRSQSMDNPAHWPSPRRRENDSPMRT